MTFRLIFLDFDGVLNHATWRPRHADPAIDLVTSDPSERYALRSLDPAAVQVLEQIVTQLDARVVISSSWRLDWSVPKLNWFLQYHGFTHAILGTTPDATRWNTGASPRTRGAEIAAWLAALAVPAEYVILDDELVTGHGDRLYRLDPEVGLREADIDAIAARITAGVIRVGDIYLDCDGVRRRCVEADGDEVCGVALADPADALWCSYVHCQPRLVERRT